MPDFRVADTAPEHPKLRAAGLAAAGLWAMAGGYAMGQLTDGWVPEYWVTTWPSGKRHAATLVTVGLWRTEDRGGIPGFTFHDWHTIQRAADKIKEDRERAKDRAAKSRRAGSVQRTDSVRAENVHDSLSLALTPKGLSGEGTFGKQRAQDHERPPQTTLTSENNRCTVHAALSPDQAVPNCGNCADLRRSAERHAAERDAAERDARAERRAERRAATEACDRCDDRGMREIGPERLPARCSHERSAVAS